MEDHFSEIPSLKVKTHKSGNIEWKSLEGTIQLSAWRGFQNRQGPYNSISSTEPFSGTVKMTVGECTSSEAPLFVSPEQVNAYKFTLENQVRIKDSILNALLPEYIKLRPEYGGDEADEYMPNITDASQFSKLIGLSFIHVLDISKEGVAYVGYEFGCNWDDEHGLGIMTHKDRVIEIGGADTSFETWIAEKDLDPAMAAEELAKVKAAPLLKPAKPWWKFW